ncbi:hypothetical protein [Actinokineospora enzanensis]|uniref:hypothetical protein n=1 Tax=Actinokineospora enzanensis TaxID=155975 RepID=UPI0003768BBF|nr:hypothetical protein [Actinokineospora enzanensis]
MTSRTDTPPTRDLPGAPDPSADQRIRVRDTPRRLRVALGCAVLGAVLQAIGPQIGLVQGAPPGWVHVFWLLTVLALALPAAALGLTAAGRPVVGAGVLVGAALFTPGRALVDAQLLVDSAEASRPELLVQQSLAALPAAPGLWLLLAGHVLIVLAGALAAGRAGAIPGSRYAVEFEDDPAPESPVAMPVQAGADGPDEHPAAGPTRVRLWVLLLALVAGSTAAIGVLLRPFGSVDAFLLARDALDNPVVPWLGLLALAAAVTGVAVHAVVSRRPAVVRGVLLGATLVVATITLPQVVAGLSVARLSPQPGPYLALAGLVVITVAVWVAGGRTRTEAVSEADVSFEVGKLHRAAGVLGVLTGICALAAAFSAQLVLVDGELGLDTFGDRLFVPAGILVLGLAIGLLVPKVAAGVRPAFAVALAAVPLVALSTLDDTFTATGASGALRIGVGAAFTGLAVLLALAAAVLAALAGSAERDEVDPGDQDPRRRSNLVLVGPLVAAALFTVGAFDLPSIKAPGYVPAGIVSDFRFGSWGLLAAFLTVLVAMALAPASRPGRAGALLLGAAGVVGVRALEYPLTAARADGATPGPGLWLSLACVAALVVSSLIAVSRSGR